MWDPCCTQEHLLDLLYTSRNTPHSANTQIHFLQAQGQAKMSHTHRLAQAHHLWMETLKHISGWNTKTPVGAGKRSCPRTAVCSSWHIHKHSLQSNSSGMLAREEQHQSNPGQEKLWLGSTSWFFPYTHIYSCSCWSGINGKATSDFTALQRQGLVGTTCVSCPHQIYEIILKSINPHLWLWVLLNILFNVEKRLL